MKKRTRMNRKQQEIWNVNWELEKKEKETNEKIVVPGQTIRRCCFQRRERGRGQSNKQTLFSRESENRKRRSKKLERPRTMTAKQLGRELRQNLTNIPKTKKLSRCNKFALWGAPNERTKLHWLYGQQHFQSSSRTQNAHITLKILQLEFNSSTSTFLKQQEFFSPILGFPLRQRCHQTDFLSEQCCTADKETTVHQKRKSVLSIQQQNCNKKIQEIFFYTCSSNSTKEIPLELLAEKKKKNLNSRSSNVVFKPSARIPPLPFPSLLQQLQTAAAAASHIYYCDRFQFSHRSKYSWV